MNKTEAAYSLMLHQQLMAGEVLWYAFDAVKLRLAENTFYTPDFIVMTKDCLIQIHEVKGTSRGKPFVEDDAAVKIKVAAEKFPFQFKMVWKVGGAWQTKEY